MVERLEEVGLSPVTVRRARAVLYDLARLLRCHPDAAEVLRRVEALLAERDRLREKLRA